MNQSIETTLFKNPRDLRIYGGSFTGIAGDVNVHSYAEDMGLKALLNSSSPSAAFNSRQCSPPPRCYPGTRKEILEKITDWVNLGISAEQPMRNRILWVHGPAGSGKSAIAQTIAEKCEKHLAASFFFSRAHAERNSIDKLFVTLAYQLSVSIPSARSPILTAFNFDVSIVHQDISCQVQKLIVEPLQQLAFDMDNPIVIIDGLDECNDRDNQLFASL
ncbi:hypothetical protein H0H92_005341 [Tricholoma furcatifolium]|nr:hypothetical protein H0H92_005341 [Tricholoma furcatifolium]